MDDLITNRDTHPNGYIPYLDGLRALAILLVVAYHAIPNGFPGGALGVDVFFVISGFIITQQIRSDLSVHEFSIIAFYQRRIRRLFPALSLVLFCILALGWGLLLEADYAELGKESAGGAFFYSNFLHLTAKSYFNFIAANDRPFLHLWTTSLEEQFYILWPCLLLLTQKSKRLLLITGLMAVTSFLAMFFLMEHYPMATFYLLPFRCWEFLIGALAALLLKSNLKTISKLKNTLMAFTGLLVLVFAIYFF